MKNTDKQSNQSTGSVAYRTFDDWHSETEGFAIRCERLDGPVDELRAAFAAGQSGMRLTDAEREAVENCIYASERIGDDWSDKQAATLRGLLERLG